MSVDCRRRGAHRHLTRAALRLALSVSVLVAVASWMAGCDEPQPPVAGEGIPELTIVVGSTEPVDLAAYFSDADGDVLKYAASSSNTRIATVRVSGGTAQVTAVAVGSAKVTVTARDPGGLSADQTFTVTVPNRVPVTGDQIPDMEVFVGDDAEIDASEQFSDPDGDALSYAVSASNPGVAAVSVSGTTVIVEAVRQGSADVMVTATDPGGLSADQTFAVTVPNREPVAGEPIEDIGVAIGRVAEVDVSGNFSDPDGDALSYTATTSDARVATASVSGSVVTVSGVSLGTAELTVTATDPGGLLATQTFTVAVHSADWGVLDILYDELDGDNWVHNTNWVTDAPFDEWYGVGANADDRIDTLTLGYNSLTGELPPELGDLSYLRYLSLENNSLTGEIPPELGNLSNLEHLHLPNNSLTGEIPSELGGLSNLLHLRLVNTLLTGEIPSELGDLSKVFWLEIEGNALTGEIPPELGNLSDLLFLHFSDNSLTGEIPPELGDLSNLHDLYLGSNSLTGEIPPELGSLSNLSRLLLDNNSLTGEIPPDFLDLSSLVLFHWDDNDGLCVPDTSEFDDWLDGIEDWDGPRCD